VWVSKVYKILFNNFKMETFIQKAFEGKRDEKLHLQFTKFSRGEFRNRALIKVKKTGNSYMISTSSEFANELVESLAKKVVGKTKVTGAIVSTRDLSNDIKFKDKKQFQGVKRYMIENEMSGEEIINVCKNFPKAFLALSFKTNDSELKIKPKAPKSGKPTTKEEDIKIDFCKLKTSDFSLVEGFIFDITESFKEVIIIHDFLIDEIDIPKDEKDPLIMREKAIRKGKIIRKIKIDGKENIKEINLEA
jgi:hypothetical protein